MEAKYFYERLKKYSEDVFESGMYYYGYCNGSVSIHRKNNKREWYDINMNGTVTVYKEDGDRDITAMTVDDLTGDDFELFNNVQILRSGYLVFDEEHDMRVIISKLYKYINSYEEDEFYDKNAAIPRLCGGSCWYNGLTDEFTYYAVNEIELHIRTVKNLCKENVSRKYYDARPIPFIKSMNNNKAIHVSFVELMHWKSDGKRIRERCDEALKDLLTYVNDPKVKWVDCKSRYPVYL